jgi:hypothetical protein
LCHWRTNSPSLPRSALTTSKLQKPSRTHITSPRATVSRSISHRSDLFARRPTRKVMKPRFKVGRGFCVPTNSKGHATMFQGRAGPPDPPRTHTSAPRIRTRRTGCRALPHCPSSPASYSRHTPANAQVQRLRAICLRLSRLCSVPLHSAWTCRTRQIRVLRALRVLVRDICPSPVPTRHRSPASGPSCLPLSLRSI